MANVYILDKNTINDPVFDLDPTKPGYFIGNDKGMKAQKVKGVRMTVPLMDITSKTLFFIAAFLDDIDMMKSKPNATIIITEGDEDKKIPARIGAFAI